MKQIVLWLYRESRGERGTLVAACVVGALRIIASLGFVWVSKCLVDMATRHPRATATDMYTYAGLLAGLMIAEMLLSLLYSYLCSHSDIRFKNRMRSRLYDRVLYSDFSLMRRRHSGEIVNSLIEDTRLVTEAVCEYVPDVTVMLMQLAGAFVFLYWMSPVLALSVICIMPVCVLLSKVYMKRMRAITARVREIDGEIQANTQEGVQHMVLVKALRCVDTIVERLDALQRRLYGQTMSRVRFNLFSRSMVRIGFMAGYLTAFFWSIWNLYAGAITFGTMTAFLQLVARIQNPMANLARYVPKVVQATTSVDRLMALDNTPREPQEPPMRLDGPVGVRLSGLTFAYEPDSQPIFRDFDYDFTPGSVAAICGVTGIGKTTLIRLVLALLRPDSGTVEIYNSSEAHEMSPGLRANLTYVPQGNSLVCDSVRANLQLARADATDEQMREALHVAAADFVYDLPEGLDTVCGERGARLSEGQAQRIAIARAVLSEAPVMLLDEFNSALDIATADTIMRRLRRARPDATIIMITHRTEVLDMCESVLNL